MTRRTFVSNAVTSAAGLSALAAALPAAAAGRLPIKKAVLVSMLPRNLSYKDRFQLAKEVGFEQVEAGTTDDPKVAEEMKKAADDAGIRIHSVMNRDHWNYPLSSSDSSAVERSMKGMRTSIDNAALWGSDTVLLVPAVVNADTSYQQAYERSRAKIRELIPYAEKKKVIIAVEEVWNKFLLSPLEFARYVDDFKSPWVKAYFDVGNVVLWGFPQDWIRTLGPRIVKLHFKDFKFQQNRETRKREAEFVNLRDGEIDWKAIHSALGEIGFKGTATVELSGGDRNYLADVSQRVDKILEGV
jgi:hexulose-6-phosphate isomerase